MNKFHLFSIVLSSSFFGCLMADDNATTGANLANSYRLDTIEVIT